MAYVIRWVAETGALGRETTESLLEILATKMSPELVPGEAGDAEPSQDTEAVIGPYELQDLPYASLWVSAGENRLPRLLFVA